MKIFLKFSLLCLFIVLTTKSYAQGNPKAVAAEPIKDAGTKIKGDILLHDFIIRNEGNAALLINDVKPSCGCMVAEFDKTIAAGKSGKVKIKMDLSTFSAPVSKTISVLTNDPANPLIELTLKANITSILSAKPGYARFVVVQGEIDQNGIQQIITASDGKTFEITSIENSNPSLQVTYREAKPGEETIGVPGKQWIVQFTLLNNAAVGPITNSVKIKTNHPLQKNIDIPVSGFIRPAIAATPPAVDFGELTLTEPVYKNLLIKSFSKEALVVTGTDCSVPGIKAEAEAVDNSNEVHIRLTLGTTVQKGVLNGKLILHTNNKTIPVLEIPLKGKIY